VGSIHHVDRRGARYHFRRRLRLRNHFSRSINVLLNTAFKVAAQRSPTATPIDPEVFVLLTPELDLADRRAVVLILRAFVPHRLAMRPSRSE
jgi:hypothetical protein